MKLGYFYRRKDLYQNEIDDLLLFNKMIYKVQLERKQKLEKNFFDKEKKNKLKALNFTIEKQKNKLNNLEMLSRFIDGCEITVGQLWQIINSSDVSCCQNLNDVIGAIKDKFSYLNELDVNEIALEVEKTIYIEEVMNDFKMLVLDVSYF